MRGVGVGTGVDPGYRDTYRPASSPASRHFAFGRMGPDGRRVWMFDLWGFLFDGVDGILYGEFAWDRDVLPSYADALATAWDNLLTWLTPFYRPRRAFLAAVARGSDTKPLEWDRKSLYLRNRRRDTTYCRIRCGLRSATVSLVRYVGVESGRGVCTYLEGTDGTRREERVVWRGPCLTWAECDRLCGAVRRATPELDWYNTKGDRR